MLLEITGGHPTEADIAALAVALTTALSAPRPPDRVVIRAPRPWGDRRRTLELTAGPGAGGWRASALPGVGFHRW